MGTSHLPGALFTLGLCFLLLCGVGAVMRAIYNDWHNGHNGRRE